LGISEHWFWEKKKGGTYVGSVGLIRGQRAKNAKCGGDEPIKGKGFGTSKK